MKENLEVSTLRYIYHNPDVFSRYKEHLSDQHFRQEPVQLIHHILMKQYESHSSFPPGDELFHLISMQTPYREASELLKNYYEEVLESIVNELPSHTTADRISQFIMQREIENIGTELKDFVLKPKDVEQTLAFLINQADRLRATSNVASTDVFEICRPFSTEQLQSIGADITDLRNFQCIPSPFPRLNQFTKGGLRLGELSVLLGVMGRGKSTYLVNLARYVAQELGYPVVVHSLDDTPISMRVRYYCSAADVSENGLDPADFQELVISRVAANNLLTMRSFPRQTLTPFEWEKDVEKVFDVYKREADEFLKHGVFDEERAERYATPALVVLDYADELRAPSTRDEYRHREAGKFTAMASAAAKWHCHVASATQSNRDGADSDVLTLKHISEAFAKFNAAKLGLSLSMSDADQMGGRAKLSILKNNHGESQCSIPLDINWANQRMAEGEREVSHLYRNNAQERTEAPVRTYREGAITALANSLT